MLVTENNNGKEKKITYLEIGRNHVALEMRSMSIFAQICCCLLFALLAARCLCLCFRQYTLIGLYSGSPISLGLSSNQTWCLACHRFALGIDYVIGFVCIDFDIDVFWYKEQLYAPCLLLYRFRSISPFNQFVDLFYSLLFFLYSQFYRKCCLQFTSTD